MSLVNLTKTATELRRLNDVSSYRQLFCVYEIDLVCANEEGRFSGFYKTEEIWLLDDAKVTLMRIGKTDSLHSKSLLTELMR